MQLSRFDPAIFLRDHWQKAPLLIRNPWDNWTNPLEPDELAGLACEEGIESRLIEQRADWMVEHGPFTEKRFAKLGKTPWTLLVQAVDHYVPPVADLLANFRFVPNWRIDDVMVSYASDVGGVGPHFDQYDVFLIQGLGRRRWRVGPLCTARTPLRPHDDLRLLADFEPTHEWVLEPGDMLYVPPGFGHDGIADGDDCMTYSIGFRAPARSELIAHFVDDLLGRLDEDDRYADPDLSLQPNPGEIKAASLARLHAMVTDRLNDPAAFARWFGSYSSTPKYPENDWRPDRPVKPAALRKALAAGTPVLRNPASRFAYIRQDNDAALLFVDGEEMTCATELAQLLCSRDRFTVPKALLSDRTVTLLQPLFAQGSLALDDQRSDR